MKEQELKESAVCAICEKLFGAAGLPMFYRVTVQRYALDAEAVQRQQVFGLMMGGVLAKHRGLAKHMGPDLAQEIGESATITVCEACSLDDISVVELGAMCGRQQREQK